MLEFYFTSATRMRQLRRGPLSDYLDELAAEFQRDAYAKTTARRMLSIMGQFSSYLELTRTELGEINESTTESFLETALIKAGLLQEGPRAMNRLLRDLRARDLIAEAIPDAPAPFSPIVTQYDLYLRDVRGLAQSTRNAACAHARGLVDWLYARYGDQALSQVAGTDVPEYVADRVQGYSSRSSRSHIGSHTRRFLKYLHASGAISHDLARAVPRISSPRLATVPRALPWHEARALINAVNTDHAEGIRDKAILLLLATLGLRSGEVRSLRLEDIRWRVGEIRLPRTKTRKERILPLLREAGNALADYVLHGRPPSPYPEVFLTHGPRSGPLATSNGVIWIVRRHLQAAGIKRKRVGAHALRHSLATNLVNQGVAIKSVADVLGHASIDTTAIYTKVDITSLTAVPLPFPGGEQ